MLRKKTALLMAGLVFIVTFVTCQNEPKPAIEGDKLREYASDLVNRSRFQQAIETYEDYLGNITKKDIEMRIRRSEGG